MRTLRNSWIVSHMDRVFVVRDYLPAIHRSYEATWKKNIDSLIERQRSRLLRRGARFFVNQYLLDQLAARSAQFIVYVICTFLFAAIGRLNIRCRFTPMKHTWSHDQIQCGLERWIALAWRFLHRDTQSIYFRPSCTCRIIALSYKMINRSLNGICDISQ